MLVLLGITIAWSTGPLFVRQFYREGLAVWDMNLFRYVMAVSLLWLTVVVKHYARRGGGETAPRGLTDTGAIPWQAGTDLAEGMDAVVLSELVEKVEVVLLNGDVRDDLSLPYPLTIKNVRITFSVLLVPTWIVTRIPQSRDLHHEHATQRYRRDWQHRPG